MVSGGVKRIPSGVNPLPYTVFGNPVYNMLLIGSIFCKEKRIESHTQAAKDRLKNLFFCRVFVNRETVLCNLNFFIELECFL